MGWQTSVFFIELDCPDDIPGLLHDLGVLEDAQVDEELNFLAASSSTDFDEVYVGALQGWTIVCGMPVMLAGGQQEYSRNTKVVEMTLSGASSTYHYAVYNDGKEQRAFTEQEGKIINSRGTPLPQEADMDAFPYTEARVLEIVQRCTIPLHSYQEIPFHRVTGQPIFG